MNTQFKLKFDELKFKYTLGWLYSDKWESVDMFGFLAAIMFVGMLILPLIAALLKTKIIILIGAATIAITYSAWIITVIIFGLYASYIEFKCNKRLTKIHECLVRIHLLTSQDDYPKDDLILFYADILGQIGLIEKAIDSKFIFCNRKTMNKLSELESLHDNISSSIRSLVASDWDNELQNKEILLELSNKKIDLRTKLYNNHPYTLVAAKRKDTNVIFGDKGRISRCISEQYNKVYYGEYKMAGMSMDNAYGKYKNDKYKRLYIGSDIILNDDGYFFLNQPGKFSKIHSIDMGEFSNYY